LLDPMRADLGQSDLVCQIAHRAIGMRASSTTVEEM